jgi:hypothetical protein
MARLLKRPEERLQNLLGAFLKKRVGNVFERFWGRLQRLGMSRRHALRRKTAPLQKRSKTRYNAL